MHRTSSPSLLRILLHVTLLAAGILLYGCQAQPVPKPEPAEPAALLPLPPLPVAGTEHFIVNAERSDVRILVFRGGPLAKYGHNHVIRAVNLKGDVYLARSARDSGFSLSLPVRDVVVDPRDARADEGPEFSTVPSPQAIEGTLKNLLGANVLDAEHFPEITIRSVSLNGPAWGPEATVRITLRGFTKDLTLPIAIERQEDDLITTGMLLIHTTDFGMTPFSVLGGGLQVQDAVKVRFRIVAHKA